MVDLKSTTKLNFYIGRIYKYGSIGDDRLTIRILPEMASVPDSSISCLPKFPMLRASTNINGIAEVDSVDKATLVLVLANDDFTLGWVVDRINYQMNSYILDDVMSTSYEYEAVKQFFASYNIAPPSGTAYKELEVMYQNNLRTLIILSSTVDGSIWMISNTGSVIAMNSDEIYLCASASSSGDSSKSTIRISPDEITFNTKTFNIQQAEYVILGHDGMNLVGTMSAGSTAINGVDVNSIAHIAV